MSTQAIVLDTNANDKISLCAKKERMLKNERCYEQAFMLALLNQHFSITMTKPDKQSTKTVLMPLIVTLVEDSDLPDCTIDIMQMTKEACSAKRQKELENDVKMKTANRRYSKNLPVYVFNLLFDLCMELGYFFNEKLTKETKKLFRQEKILSVFFNGKYLYDSNDILRIGKRANDYLLHCLENRVFEVRSNDVNLLNLIGTYPNINLKLMADLYPIGNKMILRDELFNNDAIFLDVNDVFNIYKVLRKNKPVTEKLITVSGNMINKPKIVNVKIGTSVKELLDKNFKIKGDDYHLVINGLISGYEVNDDDMIITENIRSIFVTSKVFNETMPCIRCGLCVKHCPVGANPVTGYKMDKCIKCGACKYVCPSNISLGEKNE